MLHTFIQARPGDTDSAREGGRSLSDGTESEEEEDDDGEEEGEGQRRDLFERYTITSVGRGGQPATALGAASARGGSPSDDLVGDLRRELQQDSATSMASEAAAAGSASAASAESPELRLLLRTDSAQFEHGPVGVRGGLGSSFSLAAASSTTMERLSRLRESSGSLPRQVCGGGDGGVREGG